MKFDPEYFIRTANKYGIELKREGNRLLYTSNENYVEEAKLWVNAIKSNKLELLDFLPNSAKQRDLFDDMAQ